MLQAFSGSLLDADIIGGTGASGPCFLPSHEGVTSCDPTLFLIDPEPEPLLAPLSTTIPTTPSHMRPLSPEMPAAAASAPSAFSFGTTMDLPTAAPAGTLFLHSSLTTLDVAPRAPTSSAHSLLRELETDFMLPSQPLQLGGARPGAAAALAAPRAAAPGSEPWRHSPPAASPSTPPSNNWAAAAFPAIPEEAELAANQLGAGMQGFAPMSGGLGATGASTLSHSSHQPAQPPASMFVPVSVPPPVHAPLPAVKPELVLAVSPVSVAEAHGSSGSDAAASPTASSTSSLLCPGTVGSGATYPRIASMPNLHLSLGEASSGACARRRGAGASRSRGMPRSRSHSDLRAASAGSAGSGSLGALSDLDRYNVPHLPYLTPPHLRKGKGGRQPASDPRLDPSIDPKRARRIMANRLSAAKSKMKQKNAVQLEAQRAELHRLQREGLLPEVAPPLSEPEGSQLQPSSAQVVE